jgi:anti-sigma B factor antagonist
MRGTACHSGGERFASGGSLPLTVNNRVEEGFAILELSGSLTLSPSLSNLRESARQAFNTNKLSGVILRVADVTTTDSAGLGELTVVYTMATNRNCPIRLVDVSASMRRMLEMTRIDELLPTSNSLAEAKAELRGRAARA